MQPQELGRVYPEQYVRPFTPIRTEIRRALELVLPRRGPSPRVAFFKIGDPCQFNCFYCDANEVRGRQLTTREEFNVSSNLAQAGIQMVDLTGGETTLRKDLPDLVEYSSKQLGLVTTLSSNGGLPREPKEDYQYWWNLAEKGLFGACFSYDGIGEKADPRVVHLAHFLSNQLHIMGGVRTVVWRENLSMVYDIAKMCILNNIFYQAVIAVNKGGETSAQFTPLNFEERQQFIRIIQEVRHIRRPANLLRIPEGYLRDIVASPDPNSWHCKNPSSHWISVDAQGRARICNDLPLSQPYSLAGDINPLLSREFHERVNSESRDCNGCSWLCHWEGNRRQIVRGVDYLRLLWTITAVT